MYKDSRVSVIVAAAGLSRRMEGKVNKQFLEFRDKPVLAYTLEAFNKCKYIDEIVLISQAKEIENCKANILDKYKLDKVKKIVEGGSSRAESVYKGLEAVDSQTDLVVSHDGARPFIRVDLIEKSIEEAYKSGAAILGVPVKDTIKMVSDGLVDRTPNRDSLWAIQTPQVFKKHILEAAYENAREKNILGTDDSSFVEALGREVKIVPGDYNNIKITTVEDIAIGEQIVESYYSKD